MKHKLIQLISIILIAAFARQTALFAAPEEFCSLRPRARADREPALKIDPALTDEFIDRILTGQARKAGINSEQRERIRQIVTYFWTHEGWASAWDLRRAVGDKTQYIGLSDEEIHRDFNIALQIIAVYTQVMTNIHAGAQPNGELRNVLDQINALAVLRHDPIIADYLNAFRQYVVNHWAHWEGMKDFRYLRAQLKGGPMTFTHAMLWSESAIDAHEPNLWKPRKLPADSQIRKRLEALHYPRSTDDKEALGLISVDERMASEKLRTYLTGIIHSMNRARDGIRRQTLSSVLRPQAADERRPVEGAKAAGKREEKDYYAELAAREPSSRQRLDQLIKSSEDKISPVFIGRARNILAAVILGEIEEEMALASVIICVKGVHLVVAEALVGQAHDCRQYEATITGKGRAIFKPGTGRIYRFNRIDSMYKPVGRESPEDNREKGSAEKNRQAIRRFFAWYQKDTRKQNPDEINRRLYELVSLEGLRAQVAIHSGEEMSAEEFFRAMCEVFGPAHFLEEEKGERKWRVIVAELLAGDIPTQKRPKKDDLLDKKIHPDELAIARIGKLYGDIVGPTLTSGKRGGAIRALLLDVLSDSTGQNDEIAANELAKHLRGRVVMEEIEDPNMRAIIVVELAQEMIVDLRLQYQILQIPEGYKRVFKELVDIDQDETEASLDQI